MNKRQTGTKYENLAAEYLRGKGYVILEQNYRSRYGEIDIIAEKDGVLVYFEIKYRSSEHYGNPLEAVDARKRQRICKTALYHYAKHGYAIEKPCRFDVIGIGEDETITHIENAFEFQA